MHVSKHAPEGWREKNDILKNKHRKVATKNNSLLNVENGTISQPTTFETLDIHNTRYSQPG